MNRSVLLLVMVVALASNSPAQVWTKTSAPNTSWYAVASSADGTRLAAAFQNTYGISLSTNSGATWTPSAAPAKPWTTLASSADGKVLLAAATYFPNPGGIYTSTNYGATWVSNTIVASPYQWDTAAVSADGHTLIVGGSSFSPVYYSTNFGANWSSNGLPLGYWTSVVCSGDGTKLAALWNGAVYVSTNSGLTWANYGVSGTVLACSADAKQLVVNQGAQISTNWGISWSSTSMPSTAVPFALSADAGRFVILANGVIYVSTNLGGAWNPSYAPAKTWRAIAMSANATKLVAVTTSTSDGVYVWQPPVLGCTNTAGNLALSWPTNGTVFTLQSNADLTTANWTNINTVPTVINSQAQVIVPTTNGGAFFRLVSP